MLTKLTTILMAGVLVFASVTAPTEARAGNDAGKVIAGIAVGAIIGAAIVSNNKKQHRNQGYVSRNQQPVYDRGYDRSYRGDNGRGHNKGYRGNNNRGYDNGYRQQRVNLPGACRVHSGHRSGYSGRCLSGYNYGHAALPSACAVRVGGHYGTIYRDGCLNQYGYY